jgi:hypothetical protein
MLIGDSHGAMLGQSLLEWQAVAGFTLTQMTGRCRPTDEREQCQQFNKFIQQQINVIKPAHLLISERWWEDDLRILPNYLQNIPANTDVWVIGPLLEFDDRPDLLFIKSQRASEVAVSRIRFKPTTTFLATGITPFYVELNPQLERVARSRGANYLSIIQLLCGPAGCAIHGAGEGEMLYTDTQHLSKAGADLVIRELARRGLLAHQR